MYLTATCVEQEKGAILLFESGRHICMLALNIVKALVVC